jgi:assimilatory nitrate reductase catalytic subunit
VSAADRAGLLTGQPADPAADTGATVCACFGVGRNAIGAAIAQGCTDAAAIGRRLKAGTNCGSCVPELNRLIAAAAAVAA